MAGGHPREPANETALIQQTLRAIRHRYGPRIWTISTTRLTPGRRGIPDQLICFDGHFLAWEFKHPTRPAPTHPRQHQEIHAINRAGGHATIITTVHQALTALERLDATDPQPR